MAGITGRNPYGAYQNPYLPSMNGYQVPGYGWPGMQAGPQQQMIQQPGQAPQGKRGVPSRFPCGDGPDMQETVLLRGLSDSKLSGSLPREHPDPGGRNGGTDQSGRGDRWRGGSFQHYDLHTGGSGGAGKRWRGCHRGGALHLPVLQRRHPERQHTGDPGAKRKYRL